MSFCPSSFICKVFIVMSCWSGSRPLASGTPSTQDPHQNFSRLDFFCLELWRSCGCGFTALVTSHAPTGHMWDRCWVGQVKDLNMSLSGTPLVRSLSGGGQGQLSSAQAMGASSPLYPGDNIDH